jgi:tetratricopeptide (TPR) repeat protein
MTSLIAIILSMLLCGQAFAANPQNAAAETQKADANGDKDRADTGAWLKVKGDQYAAELNALLAKRVVRDNAGALQSQMRIEGICAEVLAKVTDPKIKAAWFSHRATTRNFVSSLRPGYGLLALEDINSAVELDPQKPEYYDTRAKYYCPVMERCEGAAFQKAVADYEKACVLAPNEFLYPNRLGLLYHRSGMLEKAEYWLRLALERAKRPQDRELVENNLKETLAAPKKP